MLNLQAFNQPNQPMTLIGLMSGTSMDGVDGCCVSLLQTAKGHLEANILGTASLKFPEPLRKKLAGVVSVSETDLATLCTLNMELGELFANTALAVVKKNNLSLQSINAIGSHGQTLYHIPPGTQSPLEETPLTPSTLQLGEPSVIAERTGILTVADFRPRDMAAGGQGAPLVCLADQLLFQVPDQTRCIQNIGGIANVTVLPSNQSASEENGLSVPIAFDTGPGNMLIDEAMNYLYGKPLDWDGNIAAQGKVCQELLSHLLGEAYLQLPPPKTTGREAFGRSFTLNVLQRFSHVPKADMITTLTRYTAKTIVDAYKNFILPHQAVNEVIIGGGGTYNQTLMRFISEEFKSESPQTQIKTHEDYGIPNQYKEALAFAVLAWATLKGLPGNVPSCTGAHHGAILGKICF